MLDYVNIIKDPYPDARDPVTGEWLPMSAQMIHDRQASLQRQARNDSEVSSIVDMFKSMIK